MTTGVRVAGLAMAGLAVGVVVGWALFVALITIGSDSVAGGGWADLDPFLLGASAVLPIELGALVAWRWLHRPRQPPGW